jgi:uncharacterized membrane protein
MSAGPAGLLFVPQVYFVLQDVREGWRMTQTSPELKNIRDILRLEREVLGPPSALDRVTDSIGGFASGAGFILVHLIWFAGWIALNSRASAFDPFPYNLLTLAVSLEAIVLTGFVLRAQSRLTMQADRRADLDLQINLLAEQELTAILRVLCAVGERAGIDVASCDPRVEQFRSQTDVRAIATALAAQRAEVAASAKKAGDHAGHGGPDWPAQPLASTTGEGR